MNQLNVRESQTYQHCHTESPNITPGGYLGAIENLRCHPIQGATVQITDLKTKRRVDNVRKPKISEQGMAIVRYHNVKLIILIKSNAQFNETSDLRLSDHRGRLDADDDCGDNSALLQLPSAKANTRGNQEYFFRQIWYWRFTKGRGSTSVFWTCWNAFPLCIHSETIDIVKSN